MSHAASADLDDKEFNKQWNMLGHVCYLLFIVMIRFKKTNSCICTMMNIVQLKLNYFQCKTISDSLSLLFKIASC